jgi:hypothetical protein
MKYSRTVEYFHSYLIPPLNFGAAGCWVVYHTNFGSVRSCSVWLVPGTGQED